MICIIQAGGRGARLRHHTWNKPKCLVSTGNKPLLYNIIESLKADEYYVILDYKHQEFERYVKCIKPKRSIKAIVTEDKGTCSGIKQIISNIDANEPVLICWCDLQFPQELDLNRGEESTLFTTSDFECRWSINRDTKLIEQKSSNNGIMGLFYFKTAKELETLPTSGEFVRWLSKSQIKLKFEQLNGIKEVGSVDSLQNSIQEKGFCRFYNEIQFTNNTVIKKTMDSAYAQISEREEKWYKTLKEWNYTSIPGVLGFNPLTLERVQGCHLFEKEVSSSKQRITDLERVVSALESLHSIRRPLIKDSHRKDCIEEYFNKSMKRVGPAKEILGERNLKKITVNGIKCINYFHPENVELLLSIISEKLVTDTFTPIHGDPTFSNMIVSPESVYLIDPRGYFGGSEVYGDPLYDFGKLLYSCIGKYDLFNRRRYRLYFDVDVVDIVVDGTSWHKEVEELFKIGRLVDREKIELIHGLIWAGLSGYTLDDYDSILGAFYMSLYWLNRSIH